MKYLLDTNVVSELVAKKPNTHILEWLDSLDPNSVYLSVITLGELSKGIERLPDSERKDSLRTWLHDDLPMRFSGHVLVLDAEVMLVWGELMARLERIGRPLPAIDSLIAALVLHHHCALVTRNESDFKDTGVTIVNRWN